MRVRSLNAVTKVAARLPWKSPPLTMQISENISSTEGEIEAVEKLSSVGKKINVFTSEKKERYVWRTQCYVRKVSIMLLSPEKLLIRCLLVKRSEIKSSQIQLCCREHLILILSFVVTLRVYRVKILSCDIKSSQIHTFLCMIWHTSTSWRTANTSSLNKSFSYSIAKKHVWIWLSVLHLTVSHCQNSSTCTS